MLHCITKLENLPICVNHLQETGIGRIINSFRKNDGAVGQAARILVGKWKELVTADSSDAEEGSDGDNGYEGKIFFNMFLSSLILNDIYCKLCKLLLDSGLFCGIGLFRF